jgi:hypothetical protein
VGTRERVAEECESRSAPDEMNSRGATDDNGSRFDDFSTIEDVASNVSANMSRFSVEVASNISANMSRLSVEAQSFSADEFSKAMLMFSGVDECISTPEKLNCIYPASDIVAEECESRSAPVKANSRDATDENESRFDGFSAIEEVASNISTNMSRFSVEAQSFTADEFAKAMIITAGIDGCISHISLEETTAISTEPMAEIQEEARTQTDLLDQVCGGMEAYMCSVRHPVLEEALQSKDDLLDHIVEKVATNVCQGDIVIAAEDEHKDSTNLQHWKTNDLTRGNSSREAAYVMPSQSDEDWQFDQITGPIGNNAAAVVGDHGPKHSDERSCVDKENASTSTEAAEGDPEDGEGDPKGGEGDLDSEEATKASVQSDLDSMDKYYEFRRQPSVLSLSSISTSNSSQALTQVARSTKAGRPAKTTAEQESHHDSASNDEKRITGESSQALTAVALSTKAGRPTKTTAERESHHESASNDEKRINGESSTDGIHGTSESSQLWEDDWSVSVSLPKKRRNFVSKGFRYIFGK